MVAISIRFPAGRYHATPWGRHVNEAEVEWPPSPWRILRALVATYHRKGWDERHAVESLDELVETLSSGLPAYSLPPAIRAHSRHYMPQGYFKGGREDTSLVFDAFARTAPDAELVAYWSLELRDEQRTLLGGLLGDLGFLGRAESWVEAALLDHWDGEINCSASTISADTETGEAREPIQLIVPVPADDYVDWRTRVVGEHGLDARKPNKTQRRILDTLPPTLAGALRAETGDLQRAGWSMPPGAQYVTYQRPFDSFAPTRSTRRAGWRPRPATTVRLALTGKPLPRIEDAIRIGELVRLAAIKQGERAGEGTVPPVLSGHGLPAGNRHGHAFYLPEDADGDGHIDHVLIHAADGLDATAIRALDRITKLWERDRGEWGVLLEGHGQAADLTDSACTGSCRHWRSVTPYLHPWHAKKGFGVAEQIARECRARGLEQPEVSIEPSPFEGPDGRRRRAVHFRRFRNTRKRLPQPDTRGQFVTLAFPESIHGPLALGFGCHFGLGAFIPSAAQPGQSG